MDDGHHVTRGLAHPGPYLAAPSTAVLDGAIMDDDAGLALFPWMAVIPICLVIFGFQVIIDLVQQWHTIMKSREGG